MTKEQVLNNYIDYVLSSLRIQKGSLYDIYRNGRGSWYFYEATSSDYFNIHMNFYYDVESFVGIQDTEYIHPFIINRIKKFLESIKSPR